MNGRNSVLLFSLLLLCSSASASLLVDVSPKDPGVQVLSLYLDESGDYEVTIFNQGPYEAKGVVVKVSTDSGLKLVEAGVEKSVLPFSFDSIKPDEKEIILLKVKPTEPSTKNLSLFVEYGLGDYPHLSATYLTVEESPLQIDASLSKTALDVGDEGSVKLSLRNNSNAAISNIRAELLVFSGLESMDGVVELASLAPGEGYEAKEFLFRADPSVTGEKPLVMQVSFEDASGKHVIEKSFSVDIQSKQTVIYLIVAIIILLVLVAIVSRKREPKPVRELEKPLVQEIEGKKVKPAKE